MNTFFDPVNNTAAVEQLNKELGKDGGRTVLISGCIAFIVGGILIFLKPEWLWALTEQWKSYAADGPSNFYILSTKIGGVLFAVFGVVALVLPLFLT